MTVSDYDHMQLKWKYDDALARIKVLEDAIADIPGYCENWPWMRKHFFTIKNIKGVPFPASDDYKELHFYHEHIAIGDSV